MLILCDRAQRRGMDKVDSEVREGNIRRQLRQYAIETHADMKIMGRPTRSPGRKVFKGAEFDDFVAEFEREGDLRVITIPSN